MLRNVALFSLLAANALVGCDSDTETPAPSNKTTQLTRLPWHMTAWTTTTNGGTPASVLATMPACARDDRYAFGTNRVMTRTEGPTTCGSGNSQTVVSNSPWDFNSTQTVLTIGSANMGTTSIAWDVVRLTDDFMDLRHTRTSNGQTVVENVSYKN